MSNLIPPLLSSTPPPIGAIDDDDDEFGDFTTAAEHSYGCDPFSIPSTPYDTPKKLPVQDVDINSNRNGDRSVEKDHQDKRKLSPTTTPPLPNLPTVPSKFTVETVPEQTVPSHPTDPGSGGPECNDVYREEPPEIVPDNADEDFGEFEFSPVVGLEDRETNETGETQSQCSGLNGLLNKSGLDQRISRDDGVTGFRESSVESTFDQKEHKIVHNDENVDSHRACHDQNVDYYKMCNDENIETDKMCDVVKDSYKTCEDENVEYHTKCDNENVDTFKICDDVKDKYNTCDDDSKSVNKLSGIMAPGDYSTMNGENNSFEESSEIDDFTDFNSGIINEDTIGPHNPENTDDFDAFADFQSNDAKTSDLQSNDANCPNFPINNSELDAPNTNNSNDFKFDDSQRYDPNCPNFSSNYSNFQVQNAKSTDFQSDDSKFTNFQSNDVKPIDFQENVSNLSDGQSNEPKSRDFRLNDNNECSSDTQYTNFQSSVAKDCDFQNDTELCLQHSVLENDAEFHEFQLQNTKSYDPKFPPIDCSDFQSNDNEMSTPNDAKISKREASSLDTKNSTKDSVMSSNDTEKLSKDSIMSLNDTEMSVKDGFVPSNDTEMSSSDTKMSTKDGFLPSHDTEMSSNDTEITSNDTKMTSSDSKMSSHTSISSSYTVTSSFDNKISNDTTILSNDAKMSPDGMKISPNNTKMSPNVDKMSTLNDSETSISNYTKMSLSNDTEYSIVQSSDTKNDTHKTKSSDFHDENLSDDDDFGDFVTPVIVGFPEANPSPADRSPTPTFEANFSSFEAAKNDDFGDFDGYVSPGVQPTPFLNSKEAFQKAEIVVKEMFKLGGDQPDDYLLRNFSTESGVFKEVRDITDTNALTYQWSKSQSQKGLLKALNIDTRNILYGPGLNTSMPKFAANLGLTPLEPVRSDVNPLTPSQLTAPSTTSQAGLVNSCPSDVPTAQFDWKESGLANPLDSAQAGTILLDLEQLVASLDITTSPSPEIEINKTDIGLDDWNLWLQSVSKEENENEADRNLEENELECEVEENPCCYENFDLDDNPSPVQSNPVSSQSPAIRPVRNYDTESVNSLQFADIPVEEDTSKTTEEDDFSDFTSFQPTGEKTGEIWSNNMVPLRETHINNIETKKPEIVDEPGWLKPTILTPVLVRKLESEDEFTDFQMSLPPDNVSSSLTVLPITDATVKKDDCRLGDNITISPSTDVTERKDDNGSFGSNGILQPVQVFQQPDQRLKAALINWPDPGITEEELTRFEMYSKKCDDTKTVNDVKMPNNGKMLNHVMLHDVKTSNDVKNSNDIKVLNDVKNSNELKTQDYFKTPNDVQRSVNRTEKKLSRSAGSLLVEKSVVVPANKVVLPMEVLLPPNNKVVISRDLVLPILDSSPRKYAPFKNPKNEDDDWTDFISNQDPVRAVPKTQQRTATPELPLSIPQLSHIQPPKLPIPVITPQGLVQTKIPSTPVVQPKPMHLPLHLNPPQDGYQPSIISHQFAMQMNQGVFSGLLQSNGYQTTSIPANMKTPTHQAQNGAVSASPDDNDEWSDFVSSRPSVVPASNGLPNFNNWNSTPYQNFSAPSNHKKVVNGVQPTKSNISSISAMPDLDFIAPKGRAFSKK